MQKIYLLIGLLLAGVPALSAADGKSTPANIPPTAWDNDLGAITEKDWNYERAAHLLERAGFGGTPEEVGKLARLTPAQAVDALVDYEHIPEGKLPPFEPSGIYPHGSKLVPLEDAAGSALLTGKAYGVNAVREGSLPFQPVVNEFYTLLISEHAEMRRAAQWWTVRMLTTPRPLQEKLTLFWHDHFATSQEKVNNYELMLGQIQTLRAHANGNFHDLLVAVAQDPAMLIWLDNRANVKGKPNENFAREIMELFTLGEGQGYTEADIRELARSFTGWTLRPIRTTKDEAKFVADTALHDNGEKTFLGETGRFDGHDAIKIILKQPAASRFITRKLYQYFVRDEITPEVNDRLARLLVESNYQLKPLLRTIFLSRDFYSAPSVGTQIKPPVHFLVSTCRKLGLRDLPGIPDFTETAGALGQVPFYPPNVAGWPGGRAWINPATLLTRGNFVQALLFADPRTYGAPDKIIAEGYRNIPQMFPQYNIQPCLWNTKLQRMEPVSLSEYDRFLAGIGMGAMKAMGNYDEPQRRETSMTVTTPMMGTKSKMAEMADSEWFNLAVGVYSGFVEGYNRVKPIPRTLAEIDFVAMARTAGLKSADDATDYFCRRFLSVELQAERRAAITTFLKAELKSDRLDYHDPRLSLTLRRVVHLILSAPEYQVG